MPVAFSYLRMSRPEQMRGDSLRRQLDLSRAYAAKHGLTIDNTLDLRDIGVSAFRGENRTDGMLARFVALAEGGRVPEGSYLLVENLDRLSREDLPSAMSSFMKLIDCGISIVTLSDEQVYSKKTLAKDHSKFFTTIGSMHRAHEESLMKSRRLGEAWRNKRDKARQGVGRKITARAPAWLKLSGDRSRFEPIPERAIIVERIFTECADGIGALAIARRLNADRIRPFGRGRGWQISYIKKILESEAVLGTFQPHVLRDGKRMPDGDPISGYFPRVISDELFWRARAAIYARRTIGAGRKGVHFSNLFSGLAKCAACGGPMHYLDKGPKPKGGRYLQCDTAKRKAGCGFSKLFPYDDVEAAVGWTMSQSNVLAILGHERAMRDQWEAELQEVRAKLDKERKLQERFLSFVDDEHWEPDSGTGDGGSATEVDDPLAKRIKSLRREIRALTEKEANLQKKLRAATAVDAPGSFDFSEKMAAHIEETSLIKDDDERYRARASLAQDLRRVIHRLDFYENAVVIKYQNGDDGLVPLEFEIVRKGDELKLVLS